MKRPETAEHQLMVSLVRAQLAGDPSAFTLAVLPNGSLRIKGPYAAACYPVAGWTERFAAHLRQGYFTRPMHTPTVSLHAAPASGGTGP